MSLKISAFESDSDKVKSISWEDVMDLLIAEAADAGMSPGELLKQGRDAICLKTAQKSALPAMGSPFHQVIPEGS